MEKSWFSKRLTSAKQKSVFVFVAGRNRPGVSQFVRRTLAAPDYKPEVDFFDG